jgi:hypothetical protein
MKLERGCKVTAVIIQPDTVRGCKVTQVTAVFIQPDRDFTALLAVERL